MAVQWPQILGIGCETIEAMLQDVSFRCSFGCAAGD